MGRAKSNTSPTMNATPMMSAPPRRRDVDLFLECQAITPNPSTSRDVHSERHVLRHRCWRPLRLGEPRALQVGILTPTRPARGRGHQRCEGRCEPNCVVRQKLRRVRERTLPPTLRHRRKSPLRAVRRDLPTPSSLARSVSRDRSGRAEDEDVGGNSSGDDGDDRARA